MRSLKRSTLFKIALLAFVLLIVFFVPPVNRALREAFAVLSQMDVQRVKEYILSFGIWAPVISFLLMVLQSIAAPLPAFLITLANAALFGWAKGALLSWSSAMAGAAVCFWIAKFYGRETVEKLTSRSALKEVDKFFERYGNLSILIARLLPFVSFDIVSYAAGLTAMGFWSFFWATGVGQLPATLVYSYVGGKLTGGAQSLMIGLLVLFSASILLYLIKKVVDDRKNKNIDRSSIQTMEKNKFDRR